VVQVKQGYPSLLAVTPDPLSRVLDGVLRCLASALPRSRPYPRNVLPLTDHKEAVLAAVDAITRPGLAYTNVGLGLAMALSTQEADPTAASRAILLVSDRAAVIDRCVNS
jgi:hypothetical protein